MSLLRENGMPPRRHGQFWSTPTGNWAYDRWGTGGRPVILLHAPLFDRRTWWPVAAELAELCTVIAIDLPGHGESCSPGDYRPAALATEIALLVQRLDCRRAPIIVGHGPSALPAAVFGASFVTRAVVIVDSFLDIGAVPDVRAYLDELGSDSVPEPYRPFAAPTHDRLLLHAYLRRQTSDTPGAPRRQLDNALRRMSTPLLAIGTAPTDTAGAERLRARVPNVRIHSYPGIAGFPHLHDVERFVGDLKAFL